jgi:hypothetical protein
MARSWTEIVSEFAVDSAAVSDTNRIERAKCVNMLLRHTVPPWFGLTVAAITLAAALGSVHAEEGPRNLSLDSTAAADAVLVDIWGNRKIAAEYAADVGGRPNRAVVFIFLGTECPVARVSCPTLKEMEPRFRERGVQFVGVFSNEGENLLDVACFAQDHEIPYPLVKDSGAKLADALRVERTPAVVVVDSDFRELYRGMVNDQYRTGVRHTTATKHYLRDALEQHLAGEEIRLSKTLPSGCHIDRKPRDLAHLDVSWFEHILPIFQRKCQSCHRPGQSGPFSLVSYEEARRHSLMIAEVVTDRLMPPLAGLADAEFGEFTDHPLLTQDEIDAIVTWCHGSARRGDPQRGPAPIAWKSENLIEDPDIVLEMDAPADIPAEGTLAYRYFQIQTGLERDAFVTACEVVPSNPAVVHHANAHISGPRRQPLFGLGAMYQLYGVNGERARILGDYLGGDGLMRSPNSIGMSIPARSYVTLEMHYMPNGIPTQDRTKILLSISDTPPKLLSNSVVFNKRGFTIPAHNPCVRLHHSWRFEKPTLLLSMKAHMHRRGKHLSLILRYPDGRQATAMKIPRWFYQWQLGVTFNKPVKVPAGTELLVTAVYDNSIHNPNNPDPSVDVHWGLQDFDEMLAGGMRIVELTEEQFQLPVEELLAGDPPNECQGYPLSFKSM